MEKDKRDIETSVASFIGGSLFLYVTIISFDGININAITLIASIVAYGVCVAVIGRFCGWWHF